MPILSPGKLVHRDLHGRVEFALLALHHRHLLGLESDGIFFIENILFIQSIWLALYQRQEKARSYQSRLGNSSKIMKCRDKLFVPMAGHAFRGMLSTVDYKGAKALKSCLSEFHRIL